MDWAQICIVTFGVAAIFLVNTGNPAVRRWGPIMGMLSQPAWFYTTWQAEQWGIFTVSILYAYSWGMGIYNGWIQPLRRREA